jgi:phage tail-like protein
MPLTQSYVTRSAGAEDPALAFKFWVEIDDIVVAEFKECAGLQMQRSTEEVKEGGVNDYVHKLPGRNTYSPLTFKYGVTSSTDLWDWYVAGLYDGKVERKNFSILLRNVAGDVVRRWDVLDAYPTKWDGPQLNTETNQVTIETIEITHHGLKLG